MKRCPKCDRVYADQAMNFCLIDGAALTSATDANIIGTTRPPRAPEAPTEAMRPEELPVPPTQTFQSPPQFVRPGYAPPHAEAPVDNRNRFLWIVAGILLATLVVLGYFLIRKESDESRVDVRNGTDNSNQASANSRSSNATVTPTPMPTATPSVTPSPSPTPTPYVSTTRAEVLSVMNSWAESLRRQDLGSHMRLYASRLDAFYQRGSVTREEVRANRQAIFAKYYSSTNVQLSNITVELDSTGTTATVSYDNSYNWRGGAKYLTGRSYNAMVLKKVGSEWLITSERHIKTYSESSN